MGRWRIHPPYQKSREWQTASTSTHVIIHFRTNYKPNNNLNPSSYVQGYQSGITVFASCYSLQFSLGRNMDEPAQKWRNQQTNPIHQVKSNHFSWLSRRWCVNAWCIIVTNAGKLHYWRYCITCPTCSPQNGISEIKKRTHFTLFSSS